MVDVNCHLLVQSGKYLGYLHRGWLRADKFSPFSEREYGVAKGRWGLTISKRLFFALSRYRLLLAPFLQTPVDPTNFIEFWNAEEFTSLFGIN